MPNQPPPFGSPRLDQVIDTWSSSSVLNPRLLASELAALLRTTGPDEQLLGSHAVAVTLFDTATGSGALTIGTLATYFERYSAGEQPSTVETTVGSARASAVYFDKSWIGRLEIETEARARTAAGLQQMHPAPRPTGGAQPAAQYQPPKSGSDPECLALHQAQQRQEGERSDAAKLEAFEQRALLAEQESAKRGAKIQALEHQNQQYIEAIEQITRDFSEERRARTLGDEDRRELIEEIDALQARLTKAETALEQAPAKVAATFSGLGQQLTTVEQLLKAVADSQNFSSNKPLDSRERASFERLVYVLAREAKYRLEKPYADADLILRYADTIGAKVPTGKGLIAKKLEAAATRFAQDQKE